MWIFRQLFIQKCKSSVEVSAENFCLFASKMSGRGVAFADFFKFFFSKAKMSPTGPEALPNFVFIRKQKYLGCPDDGECLSIFFSL